MIEGLIFSCPLIDSVCDCPFSEYRELTPKDRVERLRMLSDMERNNLLLHHKGCLRQRERKGHI